MVTSRVVGAVIDACLTTSHWLGESQSVSIHGAAVSSALFGQHNNKIAYMFSMTVSKSM